MTQQPATNSTHIPKASIVQLGREMDVEAAHWLFGKALKRIRIFCGKHDTDGDPVVCMRDVEKDFARDNGHDYLIIVAINDQLEMVGHLLASASMYHGSKYIYVEQMEIDRGAGVTLDQERMAFGWIKDWQKEIKAEGIRAMGPGPAQVRRLQMIHNFIPTMTLMRERG